MCHIIFWDQKYPQNTKYKFSYVTSTIRWKTQISSTTSECCSLTQLLVILDLQETVTTDKTHLSGRRTRAARSFSLCWGNVSWTQRTQPPVRKQPRMLWDWKRVFEVFLYNYSSRRSHYTSLLLRSRFSSFYLLTHLVRNLRRCDNAALLESVSYQGSKDKYLLSGLKQSHLITTLKLCDLCRIH